MAPGAFAEGLPVCGVLEGSNEGVGEVLRVGWGEGGEFAGDAVLEPLGDATGGVGDGGDAGAGGFEADEAEGFRPEAWDGEEVDVVEESVSLVGGDPAEGGGTETLSAGVGEDGIALGSIAADDEVEGALESGLGLDESGDEVIEAFGGRDAAEEEDTACGWARGRRGGIGGDAWREEGDAVEGGGGDSVSFELGGDVTAGDEDGGVLSEGAMASGFDAVALEHGPGVTPAAVFGEVEGEAGGAESALAGDHLFLGVAAGAADADTVVVMGIEKGGEAMDERGFKVGRIQPVVIDEVGLERFDGAERVVGGVLRGGDAREIGKAGEDGALAGLG